ncbi:glycoside hydrolase family 2 TIM barrel-domain containing protein [Planctomycetota bacterium]
MKFSTAGFHQVDENVREAANFSVGWRFTKGDPEGAEKPDFDDRDWETVNLPHGLELVPLEASGCVNYQGPAWYRKHVAFDKDLAGRKLFLHFEAIMGKSEIRVNGRLLESHFGGYLPIHVDITDVVDLGGENVIAVRADNSDDRTYPPGKPQDKLDFAYFGGIYRDVLLITTGPIHISNANAVDRTAGGGVFVHFEDFSSDSVTAVVDTDIVNETGKAADLRIGTVIRSKGGNAVGQSEAAARIAENGTVTQKIVVSRPHLWHPDDPYLYDVFITIKNAGGETVDAMRLRIGIRKVEFRGEDGFWLNGAPFEDKLIGGNRHQDFACIGNALPNSMHWRDAKKLREASMRIIRSAHYPQDPAFMDACDELGLFVIVATPGWQYWNEDPVFQERVISDIRNLVRRDRNRPSVIMWEPILNETKYPAEFAGKVHETVHEEYPYQGCYTACDDTAPGHEHFDLLYAQPGDDGYYRDLEHDVCIFTREWGDCVDDWHSHNSPSRTRKGWGERAQLIQALHYARPYYKESCLSSLCRTPRRHVGGAVWHSFDHQRGGHPDPFWGGIMDALRRPKYSYYLFKSQMSPDPFIFIAHEMTPFSGRDIVVFSSCDEVRLKFCGTLVGTRKTRDDTPDMPHRPAVFENAFDFMRLKELHREGNASQAKIEAEGLIGGEVAATAVRVPSLHKTGIMLEADFAGVPLIADGSDIVQVVACITDERGTIKRLSEEHIRFTVSGEGSLVDDGTIQANPRRTEWGEAVALIRAGTTPGVIRIRAGLLRKGLNTPADAEIEIRSLPAERMF